ncbi:MAG TPA: high frequency lysogenization protein HflD, partial [Pseudomonadales bacterium]|nr:high frequency lysogenization protein HflD [Pseudomonadales bacterium]
GETDSEAFTALINSVFVLNPQNTEEVYGHFRFVRAAGILKDVLKGNTSKYSDIVRYALEIAHIQQQLSKNTELLQVLRRRLEQITAQLPHFSSATDPAIISKLAQLYIDTLGTFKYRIQVKGDPRHLQAQENADRIRAILLAGVRSSMLWHQLGGRRWQLLIFRKKIGSWVEQLYPTRQTYSN